MLDALMFFPRGGSAHVARALAEELPAHGWDVTVVSGSLGGRGVCDAERFYAGLDVHAVDFTAGDAPMHPSYEDRPDAPDRVFAAVDDDEYERHVAAWATALEAAGAADARRPPPPPPHAGARGRGACRARRAGRRAPPRHRAAHARADRRRRAGDVDARRGVGAADAPLGAPRRPPARPLAEPDPAGRGAPRPRRRPLRRRPERLRPRALRAARRSTAPAHWHEHLVAHPRGWRPGEDEGSVRYTEAQIAPLTSGDPVVIAVGRFTAVKRTGLLIRAFGRARRATPVRASLVLLGGHPGEWEGEHPCEAIAASGAPDVFLAGWHEHDTLPAFFAAADVNVLASVREQFGLVLVEGMACGLPAVAVDRFGPGEIVEDGRTGWLVEPGRRDRARAGALPGDRRARGAGAPRRPRPRDGARPVVVAGARRPTSPRCSARSRAPRVGAPPG